MKAAIYARTSVDGNVSTIEEQLSLCEAWCVQHGYTITGKFLDETIINESVFQRPGLKKMFDSLIINHTFLVVTEHTSAITENTDYLDAFYAKMAFLNVTVETLKANTFTPLTSAVPIKGTELKRRRFSDIARQTAVSTALTGSLPGGKIYGYTPATGFRTIDENEQKVVIRIFQDFLKGNSPLTIARTLNDEGLPAPQGNTWNKATIKGAKDRKAGLLRQTLYDGIFTFNKMAFKTHPETGKRFSVVRPEREWIRVPLPELALMDHALFEEVQNKIDEKEAKKPSASKNWSALSREEKNLYSNVAKKKANIKLGRGGKRTKQIYSRNLYCGKCNHRMIATRAIYNSCSNKDCDNKLINRNKAVASIYDQLSKITQNDITTALDEIVIKKNLIEAEKEKMADRVSLLEGIIRNLERQDGDMLKDDQFQSEIVELRYKINQLSAELESLNLEMVSSELLNKMGQRFQNLVAYCQKYPDDMLKMDHLRACIAKIYIKKQSDDIIDCRLEMNIPGMLLVLAL